MWDLGQIAQISIKNKFVCGHFALTYKLFRYHQYSLKWKFTGANIEEIF